MALKDIDVESELEDYIFEKLDECENEGIIKKSDKIKIFRRIIIDRKQKEWTKELWGGFLKSIHVDKRCKKEELDDIPNNTSGIYRIYNERGEVLYVGKADDLKVRISQHFRGQTNTSSIHEEFSYVDLFYVNDPVQREIYETYMINEPNHRLRPRHNNRKVFVTQEAPIKDAS